MTTVVEVRCPEHLGRLFFKQIMEFEPHIVPGNLIEVACHDCKRKLVREGEQVEHVFHRYNLLGELVETEVVKARGRSV